MSKVNLVIDQGTTFQAVLQLNGEDGEPLDVTGYYIRAKMRKHYASANSVIFSTALANGAAVLLLTANQTSQITAGRYVYDVEMVDSSDQVIRIMEGIATVTPEVTK